MGHDMRQIFSHVLPLVISTAGYCSFNVTSLFLNHYISASRLLEKILKRFFAVALLHCFSYDLHISMGRAEERG